MGYFFGGCSCFLLFAGSDEFPERKQVGSFLAGKKARPDGCHAKHCDSRPRSLSWDLPVLEDEVENYVKQPEDPRKTQDLAQCLKELISPRRSPDSLG